MSARRSGATGDARQRTGMSLLEIVVAMAILVGVVLALGGFSMRFSQATSQAHLVVTANELASNQMDLVRARQTSYAKIGDALAGSKSVRAQYTDFTVRTQIRRVGGNAPGDSVDYKIVTVTVSHPSLRRSVVKTSVVAAF